MAYADLLSESGIQQDFLVVIKPKKRFTDFTVFSGFVFVTTFTLSEKINTVIMDGVVLTEVFTTALSAGEFFQDLDNDQLYVRTPASGDPNSINTIVTYELYFGTVDEPFNRIPTDTTSSTVFFQGTVKAPPGLKETMTESIIGFLPVLSSSIQLLNSEHFLEENLHDVSYNKAEIDIYHALRDRQTDANISDLLAENIKKVLRGLCNGVRYTEDAVTVEILSRVDDFDQEYRNANGTESFYTDSVFGSLDPDSQGSPVRYIYGNVDGFVPINLDFADSETASTTNNREWGVYGETSNLPDTTRTVPASPVSTTTTTFVSDAAGYVAGDFVQIDKTTDEFREITSVDYGADSITHAALVSGAAVVGDTVRRLWVSRVEIQQEDTRFSLFPIRDYVSTDQGSGVQGITLTDNFEASVGMSTFDPAAGDIIFLRVNGKRNDVGFGGDSIKQGNLTNPYVILYDLITNKLGLGAAKVDTTTFTSLAVASSQEVGFSIPVRASDSFPTFKDLLKDFIQTLLIRVFLTNDDEWSLANIAPGLSGTDEITDDELLERSLSIIYDYKDIVSDVNLLFSFREIADRIGISSTQSAISSSSSDTAKFLHGINKTKSPH